MAICWRRRETFSDQRIDDHSVTLTAAPVLPYLRGAEALDQRDHVQRCVLGFQTLHLGVEAFPLCKDKKEISIQFCLCVCLNTDTIYSSVVVFGGIISHGDENTHSGLLNGKVPV